jgi:5-hydroxyisourate hydrolase-like protein (transthyretin family)
MYNFNQILINDKEKIKQQIISKADIEQISILIEILNFLKTYTNEDFKNAMLKSTTIEINNYKFIYKYSSYYDNNSAENFYKFINENLYFNDKVNKRLVELFIRKLKNFKKDIENVMNLMKIS